jgi:O-antigen ligase
MRRILLVLLALTIAVAPWPLGSNREWAWNPLAGATGLLLVATAAACARSPGSFSRTRGLIRELRLSWVLVSVALAWVLIQVSGWTPETWASPISAQPAVDVPAFPHAVAFDTEFALIGLVRFLTYVGVFFLAVVLPQTASEVRNVVGSMVISAVAVTILAMAAMAFNRLSPYTGASVWLPGLPGDFTGPFINGNNYATYAGVSALGAICLAVPAPSGGSRLTASQRWQRRLLLVSGKRGLWAAAAMTLVVGVLLSGSRAGWFSFIVALVAVLLVYMRGPGRTAAVVALLAALALVSVISPGGERLMYKAVHLVERGEAGRPLLYGMTISAIELRPLLGWGLNCFADLYAVFQPASLVPFFDKAHNTYLELALDLGIPAAVALILAVGVIAIRCAKGFAVRLRDRELPMLGVAATILVGVHALADFSLQIPGMACTYFAVLGLAWNQAWSSRDSAGKTQTSLGK